MTDIRWMTKEELCEFAPHVFQSRFSVDTLRRDPALQKLFLENSFRSGRRVHYAGEVLVPAIIEARRRRA